MTDRELLELAAKAGGIEGEWGDNEHHGGDGIWDCCSCWNPLYSDEQALRLAVKLELQICRGIARDMETGNTEVVGDELDPYAATRRAIVRAAAAIGKEMK